MKSACTVFLAVALLLGLSGCQSSAENQNTSTATDGTALTLPPKPTGLPVEPDAADAIGYIPNWAVDLELPSDQAITTVSVLDELDLIVLVERPIDMVTAISIREGKVLWRQAIGMIDEQMFHAHAINKKQIFINSRKRAFVINAADGKVESISKLESTVRGDPVISGDFAIFGGHHGRVFAHDFTVGFTRWAYKMRAAILTSPVKSSRNAFIADSAGQYAMIQMSDGALQWRNYTFGPVTAQPAVSLSSVYAASRDQSLYSLNRTDGSDNWIYRVTVPLVDPAMPMGRLVFQPVRGDGLHAVNATDGTLSWKHPEMLKPVKVLSPGNILFRGANQVVVLSTDDGSVVTRARTKELHSLERGPDESLIAVTPDGMVLRLNPEK